VPVAVTGSIATDHLMTFPGKFVEQFVDGHMENVSLSFLVDDLVQHRGGAGANMAYGLGLLGLQPVLVGAVGNDFADYEAWLKRHGVDTTSVHWSEFKHTARFVCTTDVANNQIASFYSGAMSEAGNIELGPVADRVGGLDLVVVGPNDPAAMVRHTQECRDRGIPFAADPSQQLSSLAPEQIRTLVDGAELLLTNAYEAALTEHKTGWTADELLARVGTRVTTHGKDGTTIQRAGEAPIEVPVVTAGDIADPTGVGDAFRAGFLSGRAWGLSWERSAQVGSLLATLCLETVGPQEYAVDPARDLGRIGMAYGDEAVTEITPHLTSVG
jgi:adenosine kinase